MLETILSPFVVTAICYYFGSARSPMLYDGEVIRAFAHAREQRGHADISLEDIEEESLQVATSTFVCCCYFVSGLSRSYFGISTDQKRFIV